MSSGRTNAASAGGEPEFFALTGSNTSGESGYVTITAPKNVKIVCGFGLDWWYATQRYSMYPCSASLGGDMGALTAGAGTPLLGNVTVEGNLIKFNTGVGFDKVRGGYCCYIPE